MSSQMSSSRITSKTAACFKSMNGGKETKPQLLTTSNILRPTILTIQIMKTPLSLSKPDREKTCLLPPSCYHLPLFPVKDATVLVAPSLATIFSSFTQTFLTLSLPTPSLPTIFDHGQILMFLLLICSLGPTCIIFLPKSPLFLLKLFINFDFSSSLSLQNCYLFNLVICCV